MAGRNSVKKRADAGGKLTAKPNAPTRARAKRPSSELTELEESFCVKYSEQGFCNAAGALESAGSRANYNSRCASASRMLRSVKVQRRLKELSKSADKRAEKQRGKAVFSLAERKARLSAIARATSADLRGIAMEDGRLVFDDDDVRDAVKSRAQIVLMPNPDYDDDEPNSPRRVPAVMIDLDLLDPIKAIQELNKIDGVYKEMPSVPAEIHIHTGGRTLEHDEQTRQQLESGAIRVPIAGTQADQSRYRKVGQAGGQRTEDGLSGEALAKTEGRKTEPDGDIFAKLKKKN